MATATKTTTKAPAATLPKAIFGLEVKNHELVRLAYEAYLAESRKSSAKTKTRGLVSGGGKKPHAQKGTGRARAGSSRGPIWRGGGVVFGPLGIENYSKRLSTTQKRVALKQALSLSNAANKVTPVTLPKFAGKTKEVAEFVAAKAKNTRRVLLVVDQKSPELIRASKNVAGLDIRSSKFITVYHILNADVVLIDKASLPVIEQWLGGDK